MVARSRGGRCLLCGDAQRPRERPAFSQCMVARSRGGRRLAVVSTRKVCGRDSHFVRSLPARPERRGSEKVGRGRDKQAALSEPRSALSWVWGRRLSFSFPLCVRVLHPVLGAPSGRTVSRPVPAGPPRPPVYEEPAEPRPQPQAEGVRRKQCPWRKRRTTCSSSCC
uniref:Uncharacterized protein n=1 Tax=Xenopus tropicalis TaxID=8364 RepID=A0A1B8Y311_XENTR